MLKLLWWCYCRTGWWYNFIFPLWDSINIMFVINTIGKLNILTIIWFQYVINSIPTRQESLLRLHCRRWPQWCWSKWSFGGSDSHTYVLGWLEVSEEHIKHIILYIIYVNLNKLYIYNVYTAHLLINILVFHNYIHTCVSHIILTSW